MYHTVSFLRKKGVVFGLLAYGVYWNSKGKKQGLFLVEQGIEVHHFRILLKIMPISIAW